MSVVAEPSVRVAAHWRLLSLGFAPPSEETLEEVEALAEALLEIEGLRDVEELLRAVRDTGFDALAAQYQRLFGGSVLVPPYEGSYELDPIRLGRQIADVAAFYRAFGAEAQGPAAERPDHVGCELEFLSFLELRRLTALDEQDDCGAELVEEITTAFLRDHAGRWLATFFDDVREAADEAPVFRTLSALGTRVVETELARRRIGHTPLSRRGVRLSVEEDSFACGAAEPAAP